MALAPAVERDGFAFAGGDLFAEASGRNRHRRATPAELEAHFGSGSDKDRPAHWFEAQLIHYGLPPSKTKAVARMRLYDAVRAGGLSVPAHIRTLEADLKKRWTKNEREAKKALAATAATPKAAGKGTKRKAEGQAVSSGNLDVTVSVGGVNIKVSSSSSSTLPASAAKKAKTSKPTAATTKTAKETPKPKTPKAATSSKAASSSAAKPKAQASASKPTKTTVPRAPSSSAPTSGGHAKKQTARRGGISQGPGRSTAPGGGGTTTTTTTAISARGSRLARRSGAFGARGRIAAPPAAAVPYGGGSDDDDTPPPPYTEYPDDDDNGWGEDHSNGGDSDSGGYGYGYRHDHDSDDDADDVELRPLGLLNGRYSVHSRDEGEDGYGYGARELVLTLVGSELWGRFDLGPAVGVLRLAERPWESSRERAPLSWRGRTAARDYGGGGWVRFLGDGRLEGRLEIADEDDDGYDDTFPLAFRADRLPGQGTRSEAGAAALRAEWAGYNARAREYY